VKKNLLMLTAVTLVAILLAGCSLWSWGKVNVTFEMAEELAKLFEDKSIKNVQLQKNKEQVLRLEYKEGVEVESVEGLEITAADKDGGEIEVEAVYIMNEETKIIAIELKLKPGKKDITIKVRPRLTTVAQPKYELGQQAMERLIWRLSNGDVEKRAETMVLQPRLVIRESSLAGSIVNEESLQGR